MLTFHECIFNKYHVSTSFHLYYDEAILCERLLCIYTTCISSSHCYKLDIEMHVDTQDQMYRCVYTCLISDYAMCDSMIRIFKIMLFSFQETKSWTMYPIHDWLHSLTCVHTLHIDSVVMTLCEFVALKKISVCYNRHRIIHSSMIWS